MQHRVTHRWIAVLLVMLIVASLLTGCEAMETTGEQAPTMLPRVVIPIDEQGVPTILGLPMDLISQVIPLNLDDLRLPPELVRQLMQAGVQHVEVVLTSTDVFFFVNGEPLPYLTTDEQSWQTLGQVAALLNWTFWDTAQWMHENLLPLVGVQIAIKLPLPEGVAEIPLRDQDNLPQVDIAAAQLLASQRPFALRTSLTLGPEGLQSVAGLSLEALQQLLTALGSTANLRSIQVAPDLVAALAAAGVQHVQIETEPEGLYLYLNGQALPRVTWDRARLENAAAFYDALNPPPGGQPARPSPLDLLAPMLPNFDLELILRLPVQAGAGEVPLSPFRGSR